MKIQINGMTLEITTKEQAAKAALRWRKSAEEWEPGSAEREHCIKTSNELLAILDELPFA